MVRRTKREFEDVSTTLREKVERPTASAETFVLSVVEGPDKGTRFVVGGAAPARVLLGQGPACELRLSDGMVSRRHAALDASPRGLRVSDLGSTNGTTVNGVRVVEAILGGGEILCLGGSILRVDRGRDAAPVPLTSATSFGRMVGASVEMRKLYPLCERLAAAEVPLIIEGETGTGKEVLAESLHETGLRASGPFVVFDCTAVPPNLVESALFGHEKGAFTGAVQTRIGVFEEADGGTLLIDEIGDLDLQLQSKLLRVLERSEVRRVGGRGWIRVRVRVIAATRRDLDRQVQEGHFRDDLFFRLGVTRIELPPLRRREGDVPLLARHFWAALTRDTEALPVDFLPRFEGYSWPGNVRELYNAIARRVALGEDAGPALFSTPSAAAPDAAPSSAAVTPGDIDRVLALDLPLTPARQRLVEEFERRYVARVLARHDGNVARAAAASGIARRYFQLLRARRAK